MSFTDQKPWVVTEDQTKLHWGSNKLGKLRCQLCGHTFKTGDTCRFVFANFENSPFRGGNFFTCAECDSPDVLGKAGKIYEESKVKCWWLWDRLGEECNR